MIEPIPIPEDEIEALVRASLDRRAERVDPRPHLEKLFPRRRRFRRRRFWVAAAAATILLAVAAFLFVDPTPARASAETLVREAQSVHRLPVDRCYLVEVRRESQQLDDPRPDGLVTRVWTRGDRFWVEAANVKARWSWGRDEMGTVWMAVARQRGVRIDPDELPPWLEMHCNLHAMQLDTLLVEVLRDFDLVREGRGAGTVPTTHVIRAEPRADRRHPGLRGALLEIDTETHVVRRAVLSRTALGRPLATVTFTHVDSNVQPDAAYTLEGHLEEPYEVFSRSREPLRRADMLQRLFGPRAGIWFRKLAPREENKR